jgi:hypothetical protein
VSGACNINRGIEDYPAEENLGMPLDVKFSGTIIVAFIKIRQ